jgi:DNA-binding CsgD family transcriptional regulator
LFPHDIVHVKFKDTHVFSRECVELYRKGVSLNEIARIVGRSKAKVRRVLHLHGCWTGVKIAEGVYTSWRKTGRTRAQPNFGYTYYMGQLVEEPREQQILVLIKRLASEGKSATEIANHLNTQDMKPRRAKKWHRNSVANILRRLSH